MTETPVKSVWTKIVDKVKDVWTNGLTVGGVNINGKLIVIGGAVIIVIILL